MTRRKSYGLTKERAERISKNTAKAYKSRFSYTSEQAKGLGDSMIDEYVSLAEKITLTKEHLSEIGVETLSSYADTEPKDLDFNSYVDL